ncbi:hypothetical protein HPB47_006066 [Ixodes persulcatus]|uniref:Uncharacterized protein n=1 Tax=Ixodes persulcatus TaxID=34615 RepID=A0AC60PBK4_IXOPE|nr:hypothetical protein HPB47_006066 [Ixodes persulcatus]
MTAKCMGLGPKENKDKFFIYTVVSGVKATPPGGTSQGRTQDYPPLPSGTLAPTPGTSSQTAELVSALTTALRAAFPEAPPRRHRRLPPTQPVPATTTDEEEEPLYSRFDPSQDRPGRYRAHITDSDSDDSDSEYTRETERRGRRYPRQIRPHREPTGARGQRLFTVADPPTKRDFRNALLFVDKASRSSKFFGTRDVVEIQLLEEFLHVWDSDPPPPPPSPPPSCGYSTECAFSTMSPCPDGRQPSRDTPTRRRRSSSEPRSPHHPSRIVPVDPPPAAEEEARQPEAAEAALPSRTSRPTPPSELFGPLVRTSGCPPPGTHRPHALVAAPGLRPPSTFHDSSTVHRSGVGDQQVVAVIQDVVHPPDILLQAMHAANISLTPEPSSASDEAESSSSSDEEADTWALAADRILRWLESHPVPDEPDSQDDDAADDDDSRAPNFLRPGPWQPVRESAPPPNVDWDKTATLFSFHPPATYGNLRVPCTARSVVNNRPPDP